MNSFFYGKYSENCSLLFTVCHGVDKEGLKALRNSMKANNTITSFLLGMSFFFAVFELIKECDIFLWARGLQERPH